MEARGRTSNERLAALYALLHVLAQFWSQLRVGLQHERCAADHPKHKQGDEYRSHLSIGQRRLRSHSLVCVGSVEGACAND